MSFWSKVETGTVPDHAPELGACWNWKGCIEKRLGYGRFSKRWNGKRVTYQAHRYAWLTTNGFIPKGMELDHKCRNRKCVRPSHLESVTHRENVLRGTSLQAENARKTHCANGHVLAPRKDIPGCRYCPICKREYNRKRYHERKKAI